MNLDAQTNKSFEEMLTVEKESTDQPLRDCVRLSLDNYFSQLDGQDPNDLYQLVIEEVERPLLTSVLTHTGGNQSRASKLLGMSRSTLRKKLASYGMD